ncbi:hypothetical protein QCM77_35355 [Bradyrhizobium sp. SSUT18]|nr:MULTISPECIES: hypothetical protein [unclassified Bradyrhizobium]MDH2355672.1 hypothetical protein [Bradyrhizobium sp. SSUT112]MDH2405148.1 hypothetical protein [Bradyrhizobium sp. SSUT18]
MIALEHSLTSGLLDKQEQPRLITRHPARSERETGKHGRVANLLELN